MFVTYDQRGAILSTISGPDMEYGKLLDAQGVAWLFVEGATSLDPRCSYVDVAAKAVVPNRAMTLNASKAAIAADSLDAAIISGIPVGSVVNVLCNGEHIAGDVVNDGQLEIATAAPGDYTVIVSCPTYNPATVEVIAK